MSKQFDLEAFKAFVASKPADEKYQAWQPSACALAQFGLPGVGYGNNRRLGLTDELYELIVGTGGQDTFGALLSRLEAIEVSA